MRCFMSNPFKRFDNFFIDLINKKLKNKYSNVLFFNITKLANFLPITIFGLILVFIKSTRSLGIEVLLALTVQAVIVQILKRVFLRNRPYWILENLNTYGIDLSDYSFPSGHTAASFSVATVLSLNYSSFALIFFFLAILIAISRIYLAVHYPTDVLAGIIIGVLCGVLVNYKLFPLVFSYIGEKFNIGGILEWY